MKFIILTLFIILQFNVSQANAEDKYLWLEEIESDRSMQWVKKTNLATKEKLSSTKLYQDLYPQALSVLNNKNRLPEVSQDGKWLYNFWQDDKNPRGIYRKTSLKNFKKTDPKWKTVLDMDAYSKKHGKNYDYKGMTCLPPDGNLCLVQLSPGGVDAVEIREYNLKKGKFVKNGFTVPLAKTRITWIDKDTVYLNTDFGPGTMTTSGYPRIIKVWKRGTKISQATQLFSANDQSYRASIGRYTSGKDSIDIIYDSTSFWKSNKHQVINNKTIPLILPDSASISGIYQNKLVLFLNEAWKINNQKFVQGEVLLADMSLLRGEKGKIESVIKPDSKTVINSVIITDNRLLITLLDDVKAKLSTFEKNKKGKWIITNVKFPSNGALSISSVDKKSGDFFVQYESFISPPGLYHVNHKDLTAELIKQQDESFDGSKFKVVQNFTSSKDGTRVPYFVVMSKNTKYDGKNPTHIFSYGGFRNALTPSYSGSYEALSGAYGKLWLERGGVFVLANIRGGGEYGPAWHEAALFENRHKAFEDFEAIARDLFKQKITSAKHLGIEGRSNGGLLVTATMTRHPELYGAVICGAPLIDMKRYNKLLAGASWMGEYGNPDIPEQWEYISKYSPYQKVNKDTKYPPILFYTSTKDDRVHPGHARKMAAKMLEHGNPVEYYENIEGGHHGFSTNEQLAHRLALSYTHLWTNLK